MSSSGVCGFYRLLQSGRYRVTGEFSPPHGRIRALCYLADGRYGLSRVASSRATLSAPAGPENRPTPLPDTSTMLVRRCVSEKG